MGKAEGYKENWHGHVSVVTVAPEFRRLGLAQKLMDNIESVSENLYVIRVDLSPLFVLSTSGQMTHTAVS